MAELGAEIARDYEGREPILVASLKTSVFFLADLSRALKIPHAIDFVALAGYAGRTPRSGVRLIKDLDASITVPSSACSRTNVLGSYSQGTP